MSGSLLIRNRQRATPIDVPLLRTLTKALVQDLLEIGHFDLAIYIVRAPEMARLNETFLQHTGSTDVITFDYLVPSPLVPRPSSLSLHGEIFICIDDAKNQARQFRTSWQSELARYVVHGVLHLLGFDDLSPAKRKKMKREENRLLRELDRRFPLRKLAAAPKLPA